MKEERDELVRNIFPQLRRICERRGVVWGEVDLRWGITDEEKAEGKVLPICLEEIRSCRPYFIGMLGERYGWVPFEIPKELIEREEWLKEHIEKSVTELEILHGVLNNPGMADHAYFYFRDPSWAHSRPRDRQAEFLEGPTIEELRYLDPQAAEQRAEKRRQRLAELKERIRNSGLPVKENYRDPKHLGELVLQDFTGLIDRLFPKGSQPDPLDRDAAEHEAFAQSRFRVYLGRQEYFDRLDKHAEGDGPPLAVLGESGSGKSALLANWAEEFRVKHPDVLLIKHFIGATPYSTDWAAMLRRIMGEFKRRFDIQGDIPTEPDKLRSTFANWLHMAAAKGKAILILDALNQLEDRDGAPDLVWLPPFIPPNIRLFLSILPGRPLDYLRKREWPTLEVKPLNLEERKRLIFEYLARHRKSMTTAQTFWIANDAQSSNPLYLRVFLDELIIAGEFARLDAQIEHYLSAGTIPELFEKVLQRYERDYDRERPGLVRDAMTAIWASRRGLTEPELLRILGDDGNPLPQAIWAPLALAAERSLSSRSGLIGFSHDYVRQAVKNRYLPTEETEQMAHLRLADCFSSLELTPRKVDELPWQLAEAKAWQRLYDLLADLEFFEEAWVRNRFDVKAHWARVEAGSELRMVNAFRKVVDGPNDILDSTALTDLSILLSDTGHPPEALSLLEFLVEQSRRTGDRSRLQKCLGRQATVLWRRGDLDGAMKLNKEVERICRELGDPAGLSISLGNQYNILYRRGDLDGAMKLQKEVDRICRELGDPARLSRALWGQALLIQARGDLDGAMKLHKEVERICRELGDPAGLSASLGNQAVILRARGDLDGAMKLLKEVERICWELGDPEGLYRSLGNQANILRVRTDLDGAMKLHKQQERICRELGNPEGLSKALCGQALILTARGDFDGAMKLHKEEERICRELGDLEGLSRTLNNQSDILYRRGDLGGALKLLKEAERICRELGLVMELSQSLRDLSKIMAEQGQVEEGLRLAEEAYRLATGHGCTRLVDEIKPIIDDIRSKLQGSPPPP
jgi:tetratricopeptide (TPR) repeat protein